jgi:hypothetical protein
MTLLAFSVAYQRRKKEAVRVKSKWEMQARDEGRAA